MNNECTVICLNKSEIEFNIDKMAVVHVIRSGTVEAVTTAFWSHFCYIYLQCRAKHSRVGRCEEDEKRKHRYKIDESERDEAKDAKEEEKKHHH